MEFLETSLNDFDMLVVTETHLDNQINDNKVLVLPLILVGLSITFLRLKIFTGQ
jgi:hypothetical protein